MNSTKEWLKVRKAWIKENPPNHEGYYTCGICGRWVDARGMELDHIIPKSNARNYENRHDFANLRPTHHLCNTRKGSKH